MAQEKDLRGVAVGIRGRFDVEGDDAGDPENGLAVSETLLRRAITYERAGELIEAFLDYKALLVLFPDDDLARRACASLVRAFSDVRQA